jgi:hypothetical protein
MGAGVPAQLTVFGIFKGVDHFFGHNSFLLLTGGEGIKNTHSLTKNQGWDT